MKTAEIIGSSTSQKAPANQRWLSKVSRVSQISECITLALLSFLAIFSSSCTENFDVRRFRTALTNQSGNANAKAVARGAEHTQVGQGKDDDIGFGSFNAAPNSATNGGNSGGVNAGGQSGGTGASGTAGTTSGSTAGSNSGTSSGGGSGGGGTTGDSAPDTTYDPSILDTTGCNDPAKPMSLATQFSQGRLLQNYFRKSYFTDILNSLQEADAADIFRPKSAIFPNAVVTLGSSALDPDLNYATTAVAFHPQHIKLVYTSDLITTDPKVGYWALAYGLSILPTDAQEYYRDVISMSRNPLGKGCGLRQMLTKWLPRTYLGFIHLNMLVSGKWRYVQFGIAREPDSTTSELLSRWQLPAKASPNETEDQTFHARPIKLVYRIGVLGNDGKVSYDETLTDEARLFQTWVSTPEDPDLVIPEDPKSPIPKNHRVYNSVVTQTCGQCHTRAYGFLSRVGDTVLPDVHAAAFAHVATNPYQAAPLASGFILSGPAQSLHQKLHSVYDTSAVPEADCSAYQTEAGYPFSSEEFFQRFMTLQEGLTVNGKKGVKCSDCHKESGLQGTDREMPLNKMEYVRDYSAAAAVLVAAGQMPPGIGIGQGEDLAKLLRCWNKTVPPDKNLACTKTFANREDFYLEQIEPKITSLCGSCHGATANNKDRVRLTDLKSFGPSARAAYKMMLSRTMPPKQDTKGNVILPDEAARLELMEAIGCFQ